VQRQNLLVNGHFGTYNTFGTSAVGWTLDPDVSFVSQAGTYTPVGSTVVLYVPHLQVNPGGGGKVIAQQVVTVIPGRQYTLVGMLYHEGGTAGIRVFTAKGSGDYELSSNTSAGTPAGSIVPAFYQNATYISNGASASSVINRWNLYGYRVTIPTDVTQVAIQICGWNTSTTNYSPGFIQFYDDNLTEATASLDMVNQLQNVAFGGDVTGNYAAVTVNRIRNRNVSTAAPNNGSVFTWNSTSSWWEPNTIAGILGYTPANKAGDTLTGAVVLNTGAFPSASTIVSAVTMVGCLGSPWAGKTYFGDGTGWKYAFSRRSAGVDTDVLTIQDNGNITALGSISATSGTFSGALTSSVQRLGLGTYNGNDSDTFKTRATKGCHFGREHQSGTGPGGGDYWNYIQLPETIDGNYSHTILAMSSYGRASLGWGPVTSSPTWYEVITSGNLGNTGLPIGGTTGTFSGPITANGGLSATTGTFNNTITQQNAANWSASPVLTSHSQLIAGSDGLTKLTNIASYTANNNTGTGTIKITLPVSWTNTMIRMRIAGYAYDTNGAYEIHLGGYNYSATPTWANTSAAILGDCPFTSVRFGHDGTYCCILLGTTSTVLSYPKITIEEVELGHSGISASWVSGWTITQITSEAGITITGTPTIKTAFISDGARALSATSGSFTLPVVCHSMSTGSNFTGNWTGANYWGIGPISAHGIRLGMVDASNAFMSPPGDMSLQIDGSVSMAALTATTGAFSSSVSMGALTATTGTFGVSVYITNTNTGINGSGFSLNAGNGYALRFWNGADAYSIGMNDYTSTSFGNNGYNTGGADYNMCFRMDGNDAKRGGSDSVARGFLFRNNSLGSNTFAQLAPFGNYTYWGGMLMLRDSGNNNMYGLFVLNGVLYLKQMA
jgi:hypothetical protein